MNTPFLLRLLALLCSLVTAACAGTLKVVLVGDSTVTDNAGWGLGFRQFLTDDIELINTAKGGRSSMSFIQEGSWEKALALKGDYYLIQFGHNDEPGKPGRSTTVDEYRGYMNRYVDEVRAAGAKPVLVTSLVRRQFRDKNDSHTITSSLTERAEIVRKIARAKQVPLVELHDRSKALCEKLGREACYKFSPPKEGGYDGTHLNSEGHVLFGRIVAEELRLAAPELARFILPEPRNAAPKAAEAAYNAVVAFDGSGTHTTVQAAIDAAPETASAGKPFRILVKSGTYKEHVVIPVGKPFLQLLGEPGEAANTVITLDTNVKTPVPGDTSGKTLSTPDSATVLIQANDFTAEHITFENTTTREQRVQALACYVTGDRAVFRHCRFLGWQDTLRADAPKGGKARQYFRECEITGHVDFIYAAGTAVFDRCRIHCRADGFITAASTPPDAKYGYVLLDCTITAAPEVERGVFLGRPWRPYAAVAFIRCELPAAIRPEGWDNWGKASNETTARFVEFGSTGPGARPDARVKWARQLTAEEAAAFTPENILAGTDGWKPTSR